MLKKQKILFLVLILFLILSFTQIFAENIFAQKEAAKEATLEVVYPEIFGIDAQKKPTLPNYIKSIYRFAIVIVGLIIFGVFIYNGINLLISTGNPEKFAESKNGMLSALIGGAILLSAGLIFNTINPQLKILKLPPLTTISGLLPSGVYICNHKVSDIENIINEYLDIFKKDGNEEKKKEWFNKFIEKIIPERPAGKKICKLAKSGNSSFIIETLFTIPTRKSKDSKRSSDSNFEEYYWQYDSAIVFEIKNDVYIFPELLEILNNKIFRPEIKTKTIKPSKIYVIKKNTEPLPTELLPEDHGVTLYEGRGYNKLKYKHHVWSWKDEYIMIEKEKLSEFPFKMNDQYAEIRIVKREEFEKAGIIINTVPKDHKIKSISIKPEGKYVVILAKKPVWGNIEKIWNKENMVYVFDKSIPDLTTKEIGQCGDLCWRYSKDPEKDKEKKDEYCDACFNEMIIIKGSIVK